METLNEDYRARFIFHLSDIHIRLYHRLADEYAHVFAEMYRVLEQTKENSLVVLTGDILHNKNDLSPECILTTLHFLNTLSSYFPTLLIAGNHDTLLNNLDRVDSLSAILAENKNPNLHYLKNSGFYRYGNILFGVSSLLDGKMTVLDGTSHDPSLTKVALYHGGVGRFSTNKGFVMEGIPLSTFDGYDMVMLGDIHLRQSLDKEGRVAYAGSMIAQNFGETDPDHGVLRWDVDTCRHAFIPLDNPYRYCEATLRNGILTMDGRAQPVATATLPPRCRLRLLTHDPSPTYAQLLQSRHPDAQICARAAIKEEQEEKTGTSGGNDDLVRSYFDALPKSWDKDALWGVVRPYFKHETTSHSHFDLLSVEFSFMFGYGPDNKLDFAAFPPNQTIGVFGENSSGKSTLVEVILFLLYGTISRYKHGAGVPHEVIHFKHDKSWGVIRFRSHGTVYEVHKKMTRTKTNKTRVDEKLYRIATDGTRVDLSEEHRKKTDRFVISQIGTPAQFLFTNIFLQANEQSFRSMTPKDRKEFLYDILGLAGFEEHFQHHADRAKQNALALTLLEEELRALPPDVDDQLTQAEDSLRRLEEERGALQAALGASQEKIKTLLSSKKHCPPGLEKKQVEAAQQKLSGLRQEEDALRPIVRGVSRRRIVSSLEVLCKQLRPTPPLPPLIFSLPNGPTTSFCQDAYDAFMALPAPRPPASNKEALLSSLYPDVPDDVPDDLSGLDARQELTAKEEALARLEEEWQARWEACAQEDTEAVRLASGLRFHDKCPSCAHNQAAMRGCLAVANEKKKLRDEAAPSLAARDDLRRAVRQLRARVEASEQARRAAHNRSARAQLRRIRDEEKAVSAHEEARRAWSLVREAHEARAHNKGAEEEIRSKKEVLAAIERHKDVVVARERLEEKLAEMMAWQENGEHNARVDVALASEEEEARGTRAALDKNITDHARQQQHVAVLRSQSEARRSKEASHARLSKEKEFDRKLLHVLHRDGLPLFLLEAHLPRIETRINELTAPFLPDRRVVLRKEEKKENIVLSVETLGRETVYLGGMEGFIVDASIKEALAEVSSQSKGNLFVIDEGISALDKRHTENLDQFFQALEERHKHVLVISHLSEARHMVRQCIRVVRHNQHSSLVFSL